MRHRPLVLSEEHPRTLGGNPSSTVCSIVCFCPFPEFPLTLINFPWLLAMQVTLHPLVASSVEKLEMSHFMR